MQITVKLRLRDRHNSDLARQARAVTIVWNYANEAQRHAFQTRWAWSDKWLSYGDLAGLTAGTAKELGVHSHTVQHVCRQYVKSRKQHKKRWLQFRGRKSLGWVPFGTGFVTFDGEAFFYRGVRYETMHIRDVIKPGVRIGAGSFNQDAKGHWYLNAPIEIDVAARASNNRIGIDLGLKHLATLSNGDKIEAPRFYRQSEARLATNQRARKSRRVRSIHAKIRNRRKDYLHKESNRLSKQYGLIVVGDVSPKEIIPTQYRNEAKAQHDAGWASFKTMLAYKSIRNGGSMLEVSEAHSTRTCADCGSSAGPEGRAGLNKRTWQCSCGAVHDRDTNAARNILRLGLETLAGGTHEV
jgi:IS605 OrfB family transposase